MSTDFQVAVIGAGPYGLAITAHLRAAHVQVKVFGRPMSFWQENMPAGMLLRSSWDASHIADPARQFTLDRYEQVQTTSLPRPLPLENFVEYGLWFQRHIAPDVDNREVRRIQRSAAGYELELSDGTRCSVQRVVIAAGIGPFAYRPAVFADMPAELVSHSCEHRELSHFSGKRVVVVGSGQSALESAALLHEAGAEVEVVARAAKIRWLRRYTGFARKSRLIQSLLYPPTDVGPPILNQIVARPRLFKSFPESLQKRIEYRSIRAAGSNWLIPRVAGVKLTMLGGVRQVRTHGERLTLTLADGSERHVDHVLLATGYRIDISRYGFLPAGVLSHIRCTDGYPELNRGFESSLPGLYFVGATAAHSCAPIMRFVCGTSYAAPTLTRHLLSNLRVEHASQVASWQLPIPSEP